MINRVTLIGNLGADPELRSTASGASVCELRIATNERFKGRDGELQERTEWHRVILWGRDAENAAKYLAKGRRVYVEGRLQTREYAGKDGVKRYTTEIVAQLVKYLDRVEGGTERPASTSAAAGRVPPPPEENAAGGFDDDEIPF